MPVPSEIKKPLIFLSILAHVIMIIMIIMFVSVTVAEVMTNNPNWHWITLMCAVASAGAVRIIRTDYRTYKLVYT